jgi:hypothetical protein
LHIPKKGLAPLTGFREVIYRLLEYSLKEYLCPAWKQREGREGVEEGEEMAQTMYARVNK